MDHCSYDTKHWPCTYCEAPNPKHVDAKCRNEEELYCPLCGEKATVSKHNDRDWAQISCLNPNCLNPKTSWGAWNIVLSKWRKYAR